MLLLFGHDDIIKWNNHFGQIGLAKSFIGADKVVGKDKAFLSLHVYHLLSSSYMLKLCNSGV